MSIKHTKWLNIKALTDFEIVTVRELVVNRLYARHGRQNLFGHLVHCTLHARALVLGEGVERYTASVFESLVDSSADTYFPKLVEALEDVPMPGAFDDGAQYSVLGLGQSGKLVPVEAIKRGTGALEHRQTFDTRLDIK